MVPQHNQQELIEPLPRRLSDAIKIEDNTHELTPEGEENIDQPTTLNRGVDKIPSIPIHKGLSFRF
jgi:hypothetical protein